ncbi:MAG: LacI family DNA-binding transcriptional regulator [Velocimicrobium sp.]
MIRLQDIADMVGVSRTTVSNVIHGNTKRVSKQTIDKISAILDEQGYIPNMGSMILTSNVSRIIGFVLSYEEIHGINAMQDPFVGAFVGSLQKAADAIGYYIMLIDGKEIDKVVDISSRWNVDGLVALGFNENDYYSLKKKLNKPIVLIDAYSDHEPEYINIGIDDFSGGYQIGTYLLQKGFDKALYLSESDVNSDYYRWLGFKKAMESDGRFCSKSRRILINTLVDIRLYQYEQMLEHFLEAGALAFASDYNAMEAINFFFDKKIRIPEQLSITGFDDNMYATLIHPRLTTIHQDVSKKASIAIDKLLHLIHNNPIEKNNIKIPVQLVIRDSVISNR